MNAKRTDCIECIEKATEYLDRAVPPAQRVKDPAVIEQAITDCANLTHRYQRTRDEVAKAARVMLVSVYTNPAKKEDTR